MYTDLVSYLPKLTNSSRFFFLKIYSLGFSTYLMYSEVLFPTIHMPLFFLPYFQVVFSIVLTRNGDSRYFFAFPQILDGKQTTVHDASCRFFILFIKLRKFPSNSSRPRDFIMNGCWISLYTFPASTEMMFFSLCIVNLVS